MASQSGRAGVLHRIPLSPWLHSRTVHSTTVDISSIVYFTRSLIAVALLIVYFTQFLITVFTWVLSFQVLSG